VEDLLYYILAIVGLLAFGAGGGGLLMKKLRGKGKSGEAEIDPGPPRPVKEPSVAPTPEAVEEADEAASKLDEEVIDLDEREDEIEANPPSEDKPDPGVVAWLKDKEEDE